MIVRNYLMFKNLHKKRHYRQGSGAAKCNADTNLWPCDCGQLFDLQNFYKGGVTVAHIPASMFPKKLFIVLCANLPVITLYTCQNWRCKIIEIFQFTIHIPLDFTPLLPNFQPVVMPGPNAILSRFLYDPPARLRIRHTYKAALAHFPYGQSATIYNSGPPRNSSLSTKVKRFAFKACLRCKGGDLSAEVASTSRRPRTFSYLSVGR